MQYSYKRLQCRFDKSDKTEGIISGIGGNIGGEEDLFANMKESRIKRRVNKTMKY